jgi:hypothetical protein
MYLEKDEKTLSLKWQAMGWMLEFKSLYSKNLDLCHYLQTDSYSITASMGSEKWLQVSGQLKTQVSLPLVKRPSGAHWVEGLVGHVASLYYMEQSKICCICFKLNSTSPVIPLVPLLSRLHQAG